MTDKRLAILVTDAVSANRLMAGQLEYLRSRGIAVELFTGGSGDELATLEGRNVGAVHFIPFRRAPHPLADLGGLVRLIRKFMGRRFDGVVYSTPKAMLLGSLAAFLTRQPRRVALVRGRAYEHFRGLRRRLFLALDRLTFACSHDVLFVSHSLAQAYKEDGIFPVGKGRVLGEGSSNGVDVDRFRPADPEQRRQARHRLSIDESASLAVTIGRINPDKGVREILEVAAQLRDRPEIRFLLVGPIEDEASRELLDQCDLPNITVVEGYSRPDLYLQAADVHLFLSHREGLPNAVLEAAAMGVPTVAFDTVGVRDAVRDGLTGQTFPFGDVDAVAAALRAAAADPATFRERFSSAPAFIRERFAQETVWRRYADAFLGQC